MQNTVLKTTAPKRRAVCLMVVLVFLVFNLGPTRYCKYQTIHHDCLLCHLK